MRTTVHKNTEVKRCQVSKISHMKKAESRESRVSAVRGHDPQDRGTIRTDLTYSEVVVQSQDVGHLPASSAGTPCSIKITRLVKSEKFEERKEKSLNMEGFRLRLMWGSFVGL